MRITTRPVCMVIGNKVVAKAQNWDGMGGGHDFVVALALVVNAMSLDGLQRNYCVLPSLANETDQIGFRKCDDFCC